MEVSTTSKVPKIVLSNEAIDLIEELVQIDGVQRFEKEVIFEKLYVMWKCDGLGTITAVKSGFDTNKEFIMKTITRSCKPEVQRDMEMVQKIHGSLLKGEDFTTPEGNIIPSTSDEIDRWHQQRKKYTQMLNRRYNKLCEEFEEYLKFRSGHVTNKRVYTALVKIPTKQNPGRDAKAKALLEGFKGMSSSNPDGKKRKTGKKEDSNDPDESSMVIIVLINFNKTFKIRFLYTLIKGLC